MNKEKYVQIKGKYLSFYPFSDIFLLALTRRRDYNPNRAEISNILSIGRRARWMMSGATVTSGSP